MHLSHPRKLSHIGVSVPDIELALKFYSEILGWTVVKSPFYVEENNTPMGIMCTDVFGNGFKKFRMAHLLTGSGVGFELFEFINHAEPENNFEYWKTGIFHFCIEDSNLEQLAEKIVAAGGKRRMKEPRYFYPGEKSYRMIYMEDPFGNILEIYSDRYELDYLSEA